MKKLTLALWLFSAVASAQTFRAMRFIRDGAAAINVVTSVDINDSGGTDITGSPCVGGNCAFTLPAAAGGGAPTDATYIVQTANASLSAEQAMGALGTGLVINTTTTGAQSIFAGTSCTNQFPRSFNASGAATCASVTFPTDITGALTTTTDGGAVIKQAATPGTQQTGHDNLSGTRIGGAFEVPSAGTFCGTALTCITMTSTTGRITFTKTTPDNTAHLSSANTSSGAALLIGTGGTGFTTTAVGNGSAAGGVASSGWRKARVSKTGDFTFAITDGYVNCDATSGAVTGTLPTAAANGQTYTLAKTDTSANTCTMTRGSSNTIDGVLSVVLSTINDHVTVSDNGTATSGQWHITDGNYSLQTCNTQATVSGATMQVCTASELLTLGTGATTTDTTANLLPAGAIIDAVVTRVTTTITTAVSFSVGDPTTAARFSASAGGMTANSVRVGLDHMSGAVTTLAAGPSQAAAAKVRITLNANPGAGIIRITTFYRVFTAPTS